MVVLFHFSQHVLFGWLAGCLSVDDLVLGAPLNFRRRLRDSRPARAGQMNDESPLSGHTGRAKQSAAASQPAERPSGPPMSADMITITLARWLWSSSFNFQARFVGAHQGQVGVAGGRVARRTVLAGRPASHCDLIFVNLGQICCLVL